MTKRKLSNINKIIIHCSMSEFGNVNLINEWHKDRGWDGCGYHYVITNGRLAAYDDYDINKDGLIQEGRSLSVVGAHCRGHNHDSIGICLIGKRHFTGKQLLGALPDLIIMLGHFGITTKDVYGHCDFSAKTCPNIDPKYLRNMAFKTGLKI